MSSLKNTKIDTTKIIEWPRHLRTPKELLHELGDKTRHRIVRSPQCSRIILQIVGSWAYLVANVFNRKRVINFEIFQQELRRLERQTESLLKPKVEDESDESIRQQRSDYIATRTTSPLLTYSNHISCIDDPVLWGALLPLNYYSTRTDTVRWSPAAIDICFSKPWHSTFFSLGKTFPIVRGIGLEQPAMEFALALLKHNQWLHLFPEGRVMRDANQQVTSNLDRGYKFKWGISKLILDYFKRSLPNRSKCDSETRESIRILPFYHLGLDDILPIGWPYIPRFNKSITILVKDSVIEMNTKLLNNILSARTLSTSQSKSRSDDEISRIKLTNYLEEELEKLIDPAIQLHRANI